ncbi:ATP-binding protein [Candidatus Woesearchaeota archaeon]|nr:MAG: ATP-binding protein [Candidatus Woesearchaeota archaeon]
MRENPKEVPKEERELRGQIIGGSISEILIREKAGAGLELGELLIVKEPGKSTILKVVDLRFGSQISPQNIELVSGMWLEEKADFEFMEPDLRNYRMALAKLMVTVKGREASISKSLPGFFSEVYSIRKEDLSFLGKPSNALFVGNLRSGSREIEVPVFLPGHKVLSHHILIAATTGRGKSNLTKCMLWDCAGKDYAGILVLDPHDEYYGRNGTGLKDIKAHMPESSANPVVYYTSSNPPPGAKSLRISLDTLRPEHFDGVFPWSEPQRGALYAYYNEYGTNWIKAIITEEKISNMKDFNEATIGVLRRRMQGLLRIRPSVKKEGQPREIVCRGIFSEEAGRTTVSDIVNRLEEGKIVVVDTSHFEGSIEILIGSIISHEIFSRYKRYKTDGTLNRKPVISIVLEEAPRVLGKEILEKGPNIFSQIAREGRKFKVGLWAITQLPSLIPRQILANMNTKIILGMEMAPERQAIIESASQDLSSENKSIASLDVGEALITSNFARFALPVKIPPFEEFAGKSGSSNSDSPNPQDRSGPSEKVRNSFAGVM